MSGLAQVVKTVSLSGRAIRDSSEGSALGKAVYISGHGINRRQPQGFALDR